MVETPIVDPATTYQTFLNQVDEDLARVITDPGGAGTIDVTASGTLILTSAGAETRTLPAPTFLGQKLDICVGVYVGNIDVTLSANTFDPATNDILSFTAAGQSARLIGMRQGGSLVWRVLRADGAEPTLTT